MDLANRERFLSNQAGSNVYIDPAGSEAGEDPTTNPNVKFLSELEKDIDGNVIGTYIDVNADCDANAQYAEVTLDLVETGDDAQLDYYFAGVVGAATEAFPPGYALAEHLSLNCGLTPMMICELPVPDDVSGEVC